MIRPTQQDVFIGRRMLWRGRLPQKAFLARIGLRATAADLDMHARPLPTERFNMGTAALTTDFPDDTDGKEANDIGKDDSNRNRLVEPLSQLLRSRAITADTREIATDSQETAINWSEIATYIGEIAADIQEIGIYRRATAANIREIAADNQEIAMNRSEIATYSREIGADIQEMAANIREIGIYSRRIAGRRREMAASSQDSPPNV